MNIIIDQLIYNNKKYALNIFGNFSQLYFLEIVPFLFALILCKKLP